MVEGWSESNPDGSRRCTGGEAGKNGELDRDAIENAKDIKKIDIAVLGLSKRAHSRLQDTGVRTIRDLMKTIDKGLSKIQG